MKTLATALLVLILASTAAAYPRFVPGQTLHGQVGGSVGTVQEPFAVPGAGKLKLKLVDAGPALQAAFTVRDPGGTVIAQWTVAPGKKFTKKVKIAQAGDHTLTIQSLNGQLAYFEIETDAKIPTVVSETKTATNGAVSLAFTAVKGDRIRVDFLPVNNDMSSLGGVVNGPVLRRPDGSIVSSFTYDIEPAFGYSIVAAEIDQTGVWTVTYTNFPNATDRVKLEARRTTDPVDYLY